MNVVSNLHHDFASQWIQEQHQQKAILPRSICSNYTIIPDPNLVAGYACLLDGINIDTGEDSNPACTMEDCLDVGGNWTSYSCKGVQSLYTNSVEANASDSTSVLQLLDMASESLKNICYNDTLIENSTVPLLTKEEYRDFWWNAVQEWREGVSKNLVIINGVMSIISVISSSVFMWMILRSHDGLSTTNNRLFLGLCIADICHSLPLSFFGVMAPHEVGYYSWNAMGNLVTCQIQGFMTFFGSVCITWYNASLCLYYLAVVKYKKSDDYIRAKIEPFLHAVPVIIAMIYNVYVVATGRINAGGQGMCFVSYYSPPHCWEVEKNFIVEEVFDIPCGRGNTDFAVSFSILVFFHSIFPAIIMITSLTMIYRTVRQSEKKMASYGVGGLRKNLQRRVKAKGDSGDAVTEAQLSGTRSSSSKKLALGRLFRLRFNKSSKRGSISTKSQKRKGRSKSRLVMFKAFAYCFAWSLTFILYFPPMIIGYVFGLFLSPALLYPMVVFMPLQGLYNLVIYMFPKVISAKRKSKGDSITWWRAFVQAFWSKGGGRTKTRGTHNVKDLSTSTLRSNPSNRNKNNHVDNCVTKKTSLKKFHQSHNEMAFRPQARQNAVHLSFGRIKTAESSNTSCLPVSEV